MTKAICDLPDDIDALKALLVAKDNHIAILEEKLRLSLLKRFGASSEQTTRDQLHLFNEAEVENSAPKPGTDNDASGSNNTSADKSADKTGAEPEKKPGRKPLPEHLPRVRIEHDIKDADKVCGCGQCKSKIGEEVSEQLDIIPAQLQVLQHVRFKYACLHCEGTEDDGPTVTTAPMPPQPIPKSNASPGLLAYISTAKFCDGMPLYRQEKIFPRIGVELARATMAGWMIRSGGDLIQPLISGFETAIHSYDILQMDETPIQVLKEKGRAAETKSYMWVRRGGPPDQPAILFTYDPSRSGSVPLRLLKDYKGILQTDGYEGYGGVAKRDDIIWVGCLAHARRKFDEALKAQKKKGRGGLAKQGFDFMQRLYSLEREARADDLDSNQRKALRHEKAKPIWDEMRQWLNSALKQAPPQTLTGKALGYLDKQWPRLIRSLEHGRVEVDNNLCENAIRPFALGRRAWLFADTPAGAEASANLYSLIETAKANGLEPYAYLRRVFAELPAAVEAKDEAAIEALLPWNVTATDA